MTLRSAPVIDGILSLAGFTMVVVTLIIIAIGFWNLMTAVLRY